jgi:hypothetical protein
VPASLEPGEQRWVSVVMRNEGGSGWIEGSGLALQAGGDAAGFFIASSPLTILTDELQALGRVPRGGVAAFHFLLASPCEPGSYTLTFQMARSGAPFGETLSVGVVVE